MRVFFIYLAVFSYMHKLWAKSITKKTDQAENLGKLTFKLNIPSGHKKAKGSSLSDWRSPAGRDELNKFRFFI
jgi:hypothetical protein